MKAYGAKRDGNSAWSLTLLYCPKSDVKIVVVATGMSITRCIITALLIFVYLGGTGSSAIGAEVVTDEVTRIRVLRLRCSRTPAFLYLRPERGMHQ